MALIGVEKLRIGSFRTFVSGKAGLNLVERLASLTKAKAVNTLCEEPDPPNFVRFDRNSAYF